MINGYKWAAIVRVKSLLALLPTFFLLVSFSASSYAQSSRNQLIYSSSWESPLYSDHSLVGKIWDSRAEAFIEVDAMISSIDASSFLLLGEKHDNPDHHRLQLAVLNNLIAKNRVSNVAFEMLDSTSQPLLDEIHKEPISTMAELETYLNWDEGGWDWAFYGPLLNASYMAGLPMTAANISEDAMRRVYGEPLLAEISTVLNEDTMNRLNADIDESHCGLLPESQFPAMVRVQQARDDSMAASMIRPTAGMLSILVAGNYHIRQDLGVPNYLLAKNPRIEREKIVSLSFMEVGQELMEPQEYLQAFGEQRAFDFIWFTPAISDEDYCASLRQGQ